MHHKGVLTVGPFKAKPYHIECACHSAGDFPKEEQAVAWFNQHVSRIGKSETSELFVPGAIKKTVPVAKTNAPPPAPPAPKTEVKEKSKT